MFGTVDSSIRYTMEISYILLLLLCYSMNTGAIVNNYQYTMTYRSLWDRFNMCCVSSHHPPPWPQICTKCVNKLAFMLPLLLPHIEVRVEKNNYFERFTGSYLLSRVVSVECRVLQYQNKSIYDWCMYYRFF